MSATTSRETARRLAALALALASCSDPDVLVTIDRPQADHQVFVYVCDASGDPCGESIQPFSDDSRQLSRSVGIFVDAAGEPLSDAISINFQQNNPNKCERVDVPIDAIPVDVSVALTEDVETLLRLDGCDACEYGDAGCHPQ